MGWAVRRQTSQATNLRHSRVCKLEAIKAMLLDSARSVKNISL